MPTTPEEIAQAAIACGEAGAAIVHIHVRDDDEKVTCDPARYARVRDLVESCRLERRHQHEHRRRRWHLERRGADGAGALAPEIASFDCGSVNFGERVFINSPTFLRELATRMKTHGVKPEIECFEPGHVWNALRLIDDGLLEPPFWFQFVLGVRGGSPPEVKQLQHMVEMLPTGGALVGLRHRPCPAAAGQWPRWPWADTSAPGWRTTSGTARASLPRATPSSWPPGRAHRRRDGPAAGDAGPGAGAARVARCGRWNAVRYPCQYGVLIAMSFRVAAAQIAHETSAFSVVKTDLAAFAASGIHLGQDHGVGLASTNTEFGGFITGAALTWFDLMPTCRCLGDTFRLVTAEAIEHLTGLLGDGLRRSHGGRSARRGPPRACTARW